MRTLTSTPYWINEKEENDMPSIGSVTRTIRFNASDLGIIEDVMKKEDTSFNNAVHLLISRPGTPEKDEKTANCVPQNEEKTAKVGTPKDDSSLDSIREMASLMMVPMESLMEAIKDALENGTLYYSNGKLYDPTYEEFERACVGRNKTKILESVIRSL